MSKKVVLLVMLHCAFFTPLFCPEKETGSAVMTVDVIDGSPWRLLLDGEDPSAGAVVAAQVVGYPVENDGPVTVAQYVQRAVIIDGQKRTTSSFVECLSNASDQQALEAWLPVFRGVLGGIEGATFYSELYEDEEGASAEFVVGLEIKNGQPYFKELRSFESRPHFREIKSIEKAIRNLLAFKKVIKRYRIDVKRKAFGGQKTLCPFF